MKTSHVTYPEMVTQTQVREALMVLGFESSEPIRKVNISGFGVEVLVSDGTEITVPLSPPEF